MCWGVQGGLSALDFISMVGSVRMCVCERV